MPNGRLEVNLIEARGLESTELFFCNMDPYVILTCKTQEQKSKIATDGGTEPKWNETLVFTITGQVSEMNARIMDKDTFTADDFVGEATIPLEPVFEQGFIKPTAYNVVKDGEFKGEIKIGLAFTPQRQEQPEQGSYGCDDPREEGGHYGHDERRQEGRAQYGSDERRQEEQGHYGYDGRRQEQQGHYGQYGRDERRQEEQSYYGRDERRQEQQGHYGHYGRDERRQEEHGHYGRGARREEESHYGRDARREEQSHYGRDEREEEIGGRRQSSRTNREW